MDLLWFGIVLLVIGLAGELVGLFLRFDISRVPEYISTADREVSTFGLKLAVVAGIVIIGSLFVIGYAIKGLISN